MSQFQRLEIVLLVSDAEEDIVPWAVSTAVPQWSFMVLNGDCSPEEVGLVMRELALEAGIDTSGQPKDVLNELLDIAFDQLSLPGGVQVVAAHGDVISPGDGCGVEDWRDWLSYTSDEFDIWMGEGVAPYVERLENGDVRVWSHWSAEAADPDVFHITIPFDEMRPALVKLDEDLRAFRRRLRAWAASFGDEGLADEVTELFDEAF